MGRAFGIIGLNLGSQRVNGCFSPLSEKGVLWPMAGTSDNLTFLIVPLRERVRIAPLAGKWLFCSLLGDGA